jgi:Rrf2 family protein
MGARVLSITTKSPYALRALVELARAGADAPVPIGELARRRDIPVQFLEQLFAVLRRAGVLRSQRGVKGGYSFARPPGEVTVLEIVELLDGPLGAEAEGIFSDAAAAARAVLAAAKRREDGGERDVLRGLAAAALAEGESPLTAREHDVLQAARSHATVADIAGALYLSPGTVRNYLSSAMQKLGAPTRAEAVRIAEQRGWI